MLKAEAYTPREIPDGADNKTGVQALEDVISHRLPSFHRTAHRLLGNTADAEDAVQDALLSAYKHLHQFRGQSEMSTWLTAIVTNCARMQLRRRPRQVHLSVDQPTSEEREYSMSERLPDSRPSPEDECQEAERRAELRTSTAQLSPVLRRTFQLRDVEDRSIHETADILKIPIGTVKAHLSRARKQLTRSMRRTFAVRKTVAAKNAHPPMTGSRLKTAKVHRDWQSSRAADPKIPARKARSGQRPVPSRTRDFRIDMANQLCSFESQCADGSPQSSSHANMSKSGLVCP